MESKPMDYLQWCSERDRLERANKTLVEALRHTGKGLRDLSNRGIGQWSMARLQADAGELAEYVEAALRLAEGKKP